MKHLSYAGITLPLPTPQLEREWLAKVHSPYDFTDFDPYNSDRPLSPSVPTPPIPRPTDFKFNTLYWPTGGARPAWFHFVCEESRLLAIRAVLGPTSIPAPLTLFDGKIGKTVTAAMRMLPERPLNVTTGTINERYYLCTLTDERYFWYFRRGSVAAPSSWTGLFASIGALLGTTVAVDTVDPLYGTPSEKWATEYRSPGALLDAVAYSVGQRISVLLNGAVRSVNWETAKLASSVYFALASKPVSGGRTSAAGIARQVPASVKVVYGDSSSASPHVVTKTLASLAMPEYGGATGLAGYHDVVWPDGTFDGTNTSVLALRAGAAAKDRYGWYLSDPDVAWIGTEPWVPTGWEDRVEWTMTVRDDGPFAMTTVRRGPWQEFVSGDFANDPPGLTVEEVDGVPSVKNVTTLQFHQDDGFVVSEPVAHTALVRLTQLTYSCGLERLPGTTDVHLNLTNVVFDGLYWDNDNCILGIDFDPCTLTLVGNTLTVNLSEIAGDVAVTSLKVVTPTSPPGCDYLSFDKVPVSTTTETLVNDVTLALYAGNLRLTKTRTVYTNHFNAAGVHVNRTAGSPTETTTDIGVCLFAECCDADDLFVTMMMDPDPAVGEPPLSVDFTVLSVTGGVPPYTYLWEFGDGTTSTAESPPTHVYSQVGYYQITLTVTDQCGETARDVKFAIVTEEPCECDTLEDGEIPTDYSYTLSGGTTDFAGANGSWAMYLTRVNGNCGYVGSIGSWLVLNQFVSPDVTMQQSMYDALGSGQLVWTSTFSQATVCSDFVQELTAQVGAGTPPTMTLGAVTHAPEPCPSCACADDCDAYAITGGDTLTRVGDACTWTGGGWTLTDLGGGDWSLTDGVDTLTASGWDGTGCKGFVSITAAKEVCCAD